MNPYEILGVAPDAPDDDVARAYRSLAKRYHPDLHPHDEAAARRMEEINRAYAQVKKLRRRSSRSRRGADPEQMHRYEVWREHTRPARPRRDPIGVVIGVMLAVLFVSVVVNLLFHGTSQMRPTPPPVHIVQPPGF